MKNIILWVLAIIGLIFLAGCVSQAKKNQTEIKNLPDPAIGAGDEYAAPFLQ